MEIGRINNLIRQDSYKSKAGTEAVEKVDSVVSGAPEKMAGVSRESIVNQVFDAKKILWKSKWLEGSSICKGIALAPDGGLLAGTYCDLVKIDAKTGAVQWKKRVYDDKVRNICTAPVTPAPDGSVLMGTTDGRLYSMDPKTGDEIWSYKTGAYETNPAIAPDGTIYCAKNKDLAALTPDGEEKFEIPLDLPRMKISCVDKESAAYLNADDNIIAVDPRGSVRWRCKGREVRVFADDPDNVYTSASKSLPNPEHENSTIFHTVLSARDPKTGKKRWENEYDYARVGGYHNGMVFVQEHKRFSAVDAKTGKPIWEKDVERIRNIRAIVNDGTVVVSWYGNLEALDAETGKRKWVLKSKSIFSDSPAHVTKRGTIVINDNERVYGVDLKTGMVKYKQDMEKGVRGTIMSRDESVIYARESNTGTIVALDHRTAGERARDAVNNPREDKEKSPGDVKIQDEFVIIDGVRIRRNKD